MIDAVKQSVRRWRNAQAPAESSGQHIDRIFKGRAYRASQRRLYRVYVPREDPAPRPMVMVLHGCLQTHRDIQLISDFDRLADRHNFILVYPFVTRYADMRGTHCWGWWRSEHIRPGSGEVEDLWQIAEEVCADFAVDRRRIHVAGLSSGAAMSVAALTVHNQRFASGAAVAGVAYGESASVVTAPSMVERRYRPMATTLAQMRRAGIDKRLPPLCIVHSYHDTTVEMQAGKNLRDVWLNAHNLRLDAVRSSTCQRTNGLTWTRTRYGRRFNKPSVETVFIEGPEHGWCGGPQGRFSDPRGPHVSSLIWRFLRRHRTPG